MKGVVKLLKEGKKAPLIKIKPDKRLRKGDVIMLRSAHSPSRSIKVRVTDIKEYTAKSFSIKEELRAIYTETKLNAILNNSHVDKIYVVYVELMRNDS